MALADPALRALYDLKVCVQSPHRRRGRHLILIYRFLYNVIPILCWQDASDGTCKSEEERSMVSWTSQ